MDEKGEALEVRDGLGLFLVAWTWWTVLRLANDCTGLHQHRERSPDAVRHEDGKPGFLHLSVRHQFRHDPKHTAKATDTYCGFETA